MDIFTQMKHQAEEEAARRRRAMRLKNLIPEKVVEQMDIAEKMDILNRSLDVYGMVLNGIDIVNNVSDAVEAWNGVRAVAQEGELGMTTLKESARLAELTNTMKVTDSIMAFERFLFAANVVGVLTTYIGVWLSIAGAWAAAKANILSDNAMSGAARGVVVGANDGGPHYLTNNFLMRARPSYPMYREAELAARNFYNISLLAGYAEGKSLSLNQKGNLFKAIHHRFGEGSRLYYSGNFKEWEPARKVDYYLQCAGIFRRCLVATD